MGLTLMPADARDRWANAALTYPEVGLTAGYLPRGYHHLARRAGLGSGHQAFADAADAVMHWHVQVGAGLDVSASSPTAVPGAVVLLGLGIGWLRLQAPCRVVYVVDEPRLRGFAYGTLAGHPESGEEAFITFTITAFSRPATRISKIAKPLGRIVQRRITARYLRALVH